MRKQLTSLAVAGVAIAAVLVGSPAANAEDTTTTFELVAGGLTIAPQPSAALNTAQTGASDVLGLLGQVTVTDSRGNNSGWTVTVSSSDFALAADSGDTTIAATQVQYNPGNVDRTGTVTTPRPRWLASIPPRRWSRVRPRGATTRRRGIRR